MAQKATRKLVDDLDGSPAVATVRFGYAGRDYEIELSEEHARLARSWPRCCTRRRWPAGTCAPCWAG